MSMDILSLFPPALAALSLLLLFLTVKRIVGQKPQLEDQSWRDRPPMIFRMVRPIVNLFAHNVVNSVDPYKLQHLKERLNSGGMAYTIRPEEFIVTKRVFLGFGILLFIYFYLMLDVQKVSIITLLSVMVPLGYFYPDLWLRDQIKNRQHQISKTFPFFLDLLVLSMRAGLNFSSALDHAVVRIPNGPVRDEFTRMLRETRTGVSRKEALLNLAARTQMPAVSNFVSAVNQAEETGGEIGNVLMVQADQRRSERFLRAEKLANQAPVKMLAPLIGLLFPITFIIIAFPLYIRARDTGVLDFFLK